MISVRNTSDVPTVNVWLEVLQGAQGREVLPCFWSANAITLLPHESRELRVSFRTASLAGAQAHCMVEGFNAMPREISIATGHLVPLAIKPLACKLATEQYRGQTIDLSYVSTATTGPRFTSWPLPVAVDGKIDRYVHLDLCGTTPGHTTVAFRGLSEGEHTITVGYPNDPATLETIKIKTPSRPVVSLLPRPVASKSSDPEHGYPEKLFDVSLTSDMIGTDDLTGYTYASVGLHNFMPVIWTRYSKSVTAGGLVYAERNDQGPAGSKVFQIKLRFYAADPGTSAKVPATHPDETIDIPKPNNPNLNYYPFTHIHAGRYVVLQLIGQDRNPGGAELRLVAP